MVRALCLALCTSAVHERERRIGPRPSTMGYRPPREHGPVCRCDAVLPLCDAVVGRSRERRTRARAPLPGRSRRREGKGRVQAPVARLCLCKSLASRRLLNSTQLNSTQLNSTLPSTLTHLATPLGSASATLARRRVTTLLVELALRANEPAPENTGAPKCRLRLACLQVSRWTRRSRDAE